MVSKKFLIIAITVAAAIGYGVTVLQSDNNTDGSSQPATTTANTVDYSGQGLTAFPQQVLNNTKITSLNLSNNGLTGSLPAEIRSLTNLEILNVSNNNMTGIPAEIGQLRKLKVLNYANNQITGLPNELGNLTQLQTFDLSGNPNVSQRDLAGIRSKLPNTDIKL